MLEEIAEGVYVHVSEFIQSNTVVVDGEDGVLLIDPGITRDELACIARDLRALGRPVVAAFSTHPHWDHVLWDAAFGGAPRYASARGADIMAEFLTHENWVDEVAEGLPPEHADEIPMELLGLVTGLPAGSTMVPWNGPAVRVLEHRGHSEGHAALLVEHAGVLVAGDMLSDTLMPFLDLQAEHPINDYLAALDLFDSVAAGVRVVVPGHGGIGRDGAARARIDLDRAYVVAVRDGVPPVDPRIGPDAPLDWIPEVHEWQVRALEESGAS